MRTRIVAAGSVLAGALALGVVAAQPAQSTIPAGKRAGTVTFVDIAGSTDLKVHVRSFSWGVSVAGGHTGGGGGQGKPTFTALNLSTEATTSSPMLWLASAKGTHIKEATLVVNDPDTGDPAFKYKLTEVLITAVQEGRSGNGETNMQISLDYATVEAKALAANGTVAHTFCYDLAASVTC